ncbi:F-box DNA helicase 1-like [Glandiceps talaboti]
MRQSTLDRFYAKVVSTSTRKSESSSSEMSSLENSSDFRGTTGEQNQKKRKLEMNSAEYLKRSSTASGTNALTNPTTVPKSSKDTNRGLYPRSSKQFKRASTTTSNGRLLSKCSTQVHVHITDQMNSQTTAVSPHPTPHQQYQTQERITDQMNSQTTAVSPHPTPHQQYQVYNSRALDKNASNAHKNRPSRKASFSTASHFASKQNKIASYMLEPQKKTATSHLQGSQAKQCTLPDVQCSPKPTMSSPSLWSRSTASASTLNISRKVEPPTASQSFGGIASTNEVDANILEFENDTETDDLMASQAMLEIDNTYENNQGKKQTPYRPVQRETCKPNVSQNTKWYKSSTMQFANQSTKPNQRHYVSLGLGKSCIGNNIVHARTQPASTSSSSLQRTPSKQYMPTKSWESPKATIASPKSWSRSKTPGSSANSAKESGVVKSMQAIFAGMTSANQTANLPNALTDDNSKSSTCTSAISESNMFKPATVTCPDITDKDEIDINLVAFENDTEMNNLMSLPNLLTESSKAGSSTKPADDVSDETDKDEIDMNLVAFENDTEMDDLMALQSMPDDIDTESAPNTYGLLGEEVNIEEEEGEDYFGELPVEVIENIFSQLPMIDLCLNVNRVCQLWNGIISDPQFMPWKKKYHKLKLKDPPTHKEIMQIMRKNKMVSEDDCLLQIVRYMKIFKRRSNAMMVDHLQKHPKYEFAVNVMKEKLSDTIVDDVPNPWCVIAMIVVLSETVKDIQLILQLLLNNSTTTLASDVIECLYCVATFLFALHSIHNLNRGIHYRVFYALYLYENVTVSTPADWKASIPRGGGQQSLVSYGVGLRGGLRFTHEQQRIVKFDCEKNDIVKIMAFAGTGKTSTLKEYAKRRPNKKFLYVCFNKSVQEQAQQSFPYNVTCKTVHSLAFASYGRRYIKQLSPDIKAYYVTHQLPENRNNFVRGKQVKETLDAFIASAADFITTAHTPNVYKNDDGYSRPISHEEQMAIVRDTEVIWEKYIDKDNWDVRMTHGGYLKLYQLSKPTLDEFDCIMIDEGQDCTPATQDILFRQNCPKILVGDPHQQIYSFIGARNAMKEAPASNVFYLTQSFRFGPQISYIAACLLENFKDVTAKTIVGNAKQDGVYGDSVGQIAIITRFNYTLFNEAVMLSNREQPCKIAFAGGKKFLEDLLSSVEDIFTLFCRTSAQSGTTSTMKDREIKNKFIKKFASFNSLKNYASNVQDNELLYKIHIVEIHHVKIPRHTAKIRSRACHDMRLADVVLSTAHKSKGLEFDTVKLTDDYLSGILNYPDGVSYQDLPEDELNLLYVAVTRAKKRLLMNRVLLQVLSQVGENFEYPVSSQTYKSTVEAPLCYQSQCYNTADLRNTVVLEKKALTLSTGSSIPGGVGCDSHSLHPPPGFKHLLKLVEKTGKKGRKRSDKKEQKCSGQ